MKSKKKKIFNAFFVLICFLLTLYYVFHGQDLSSIMYYVREANSVYWLAGVGLVLVYILSEASIIHYLLKTLDCRSKFISCCKYSFVGFFFSCITPSATGGQPAQTVIMKKDKIPVHVSTVVLLIITIWYKTLLIVYGTFVLLVKPAGVMKYLQPILAWVYLGIFLNVVAVVVLLLVASKPKLAESLVNGIYVAVSKIARSKKVDAYKDRVEQSIKKFSINSDYIVTHQKAMFTSFAITFVQRTLLFSITYLVCVSFGSCKIDVFDTTMLQAMISVAVDMLPLPGGMGITEHLFILVFGPALGNNITVPVMIVSRGISYYTQLIMSAIVTGFAYIKFYGINIWRKNQR